MSKPFVLFMYSSSFKSGTILTTNQGYKVMVVRPPFLILVKEFFGFKKKNSSEHWVKIYNGL